MANTNVIKNEIQPFVREWLKQKYGVAFGRSKLPLHECEGWHDFDAVSTDGRVVAEIKAASAWTSGGKHPSGKRASAFEQLYFLSLAQAQQKLLVLTDLEFFRIMKSKCQGVVPSNIELVYCPLSVELQALVLSVTNEASAEIDRGKKSFRKQAH